MNVVLAGRSVLYELTFCSKNDFFERGKLYSTGLDFLFVVVFSYDVRDDCGKKTHLL